MCLAVDVVAIAVVVVDVVSVVVSDNVVIAVSIMSLLEKDI